MHSSVIRFIVLTAAVVLAPAIASATDTVNASHPASVCGLLTKAEVARYLGKPVGAVAPVGAASGCAYHAADGSNDGVLLIRESHGDWDPPTNAALYHAVSGVGEKAYTAFETGIGFEAGVLSIKGSTNVQMSGKAGADAALALARIAMTR